jgi:alkylhydroperoxidase/carboxymuconolactone decarboxylase family protein YurZ
MSHESSNARFTSLDLLFAKPAVAQRIRGASPTCYEAVAQFWRAPFESAHLPARMKELILLAVHAAATTLSKEAVERHVERAQAAGASVEDIIDVLVSIVSLANHAVYFAVPVLEEELKALGQEEAGATDVDADLERAKDHFVHVRGFWNAERDKLATQMPAYFKALLKLGTESWQHGSLTRKERELICIAIDCSVTHAYAPGLRIHIRNAIREGATREEILEVFQLAALLGVETLVMGGNALFGGG